MAPQVGGATKRAHCYKTADGQSVGSGNIDGVSMVGALRGFSRTVNTPSSGSPGAVAGIGKTGQTTQTLVEVIKDLSGSNVEVVERGKTIFFPGDPAERVYLLRRGAVRLSRVYESGEEITVALLRENSLFGVLSLLTGQRSDRFYHAIAFPRVELVTAPATSVRQAIEENASVGLLLLQGLSSRILQTETMIETLTHRDMSSRLVSFLLVLCRDFGVPGGEGITIDLRLSHQAIAEAIGSTRVTITRLLGDLRQDGLLQIDRKKITVFDPIALAKRFN
jgi:CRP/FNR family transcriptional regulator, global nitrogen regulator